MSWKQPKYSSTEAMDKEGVVPVYSEILLSHKKEIGSFVEMRMDLESLTHRVE